MKKKLFVDSKSMPEDIFNKEILYPKFKITHPKIPFLMYTPIVIGLVYYSFFILNLDPFSFLIYFLPALIFWPTLEYFMHRFLLHYKPSSSFGKRLMYTIHYGHHDYPNDLRLVLVNPEVSIIGFIIFYISGYYLIGAININPFMAGMTSCYIFYDWLHYAAHHYNFKNSLFQKYKRHHMDHHYIDNDKNFGFMTTTWDSVMNTYVERDK